MQAIFSESPWIALMVFGIPAFVISLVCYTVCCLAPADDDDIGPSSDDDADDSENTDCKPWLRFILLISRCIVVVSLCVNKYVIAYKMTMSLYVCVCELGM